MSDIPPPLSPTKSATSDVSSTSATIDKPQTTSKMTSASSTSSIASKPSGIKPPSAITRIGRPCLGHGTPKAGPPPLSDTMSKFSSFL